MSNVIPYQYQTINTKQKCLLNNYNNRHLSVIYPINAIQCFSPIKYMKAQYLILMQNDGKINTMGIVNNLLFKYNAVM